MQTMTFKEVEAWAECEARRLFNEHPPVIGKSYKNPVTHYWFLPGGDPIEPQIKAARDALLARAFVALPPGAPALPINMDEVDKIKWKGDPFLHVVGCFAESLYLNEFDFLHHPSFHDFVCGLMVSENTPDFVRNSKQMLKRFPPRRLRGIRPGLIWQPPRPRKMRWR